MIAYLGFQLLFPWRYVLYPGNLFWTEEGYRFSWRVMLMEKAGTATFYVKDTRSGREGVVDNREFLNPHQEKQMAMQPDMILQFAHFLGRHYEEKGVYKP
ncbi:HTTM domain-containing protein, partial [Arthrospira platensis SPKY1]|nr:HTTM domain-containing protein [Arthrospira platensis SPKY1]